MIRKGCRGWLLTLALVLVAACVGGCGSSTQSGPAELEFVAVQRGSLVSSIAAVGSVRPRAEVVLSFAVAGRISRVAVTSGQQVEEGQVLAKLDEADLELQVRSAEAALSAAQARLEQLEAGPGAEQLSAAEARLDAVQAALDQATAQRDQLLAGATDARIAAAQAAFKSARAYYERVKAGPTAADLAGAQAALDSAQAALDQAQAAYD